MPTYLFADRLLHIAWLDAPRMFGVVAGCVAERPDCGHLVAACEVVEAVRDGRAWRSRAMFGNDWPWWSFYVPRMCCEVLPHNTLPAKIIQLTATS